MVESMSFNFGEIVLNLHERLNKLQRKPDSVEKLQGIREIINDLIVITNFLTEAKNISDQFEAYGLVIEPAIERIKNSKDINARNAGLELVLNYFERITYTKYRVLEFSEDRLSIKQLPYSFLKECLENLSIYSIRLARAINKFNQSHEELRRLRYEENLGMQMTVCLTNLQSAMRNLLISADKVILNIAQILNDFIFRLGEI